jgi:putative polyketide hydroxylase
VHLHTEVLGVEHRPDGVEVVLRDGASGDLRTIPARYLVAADGAHSRIRRGLGIAMRGPDGLGHVVHTVFRAPLWEVVGDHRYGIYRVTPRGGTGMNTAIRGGHDLGWKLGWVLRGWAGADLLDSYEAERRPVAAHNVARSADPDGSTREAADEVHVDLGGRIPHVWVRTGDGRASTLDLLGPGLTLFTGPDSAPWDARPAGGPPVTVRALDAVSARAIGIRGGAALLVRPDATPARMWTHEAAAA